MSDAILIVDDDPDIRTFLEVTLELAGFEVQAGINGADAIEKALSVQPALIVMDVMMPVMDGMESCRRLRADARTSHIPIIMLTARAQGTDKVEGLAAGADDYVTKPFDPDELVARVEATLRRAGQMKAVSPLTGLPGNARIEGDIARRAGTGERFALLYADLNNFKAYNDHYGFLRGDDVIKTLANVLADVGNEHGDDQTFIGHVGGDDFVVICGAEQLEQIAAEVCRRFDDRVPALYDPDDRERGYVVVADRQGNDRQYPLTSVSIGIATNRNRAFVHPSEPVEIATEMKSFAKASSHGPSNWAADQRDSRPST
ncbi:MAG TPA: response regulator [Nitriliruptorales bacterium]